MEACVNAPCPAADSRIDAYRRESLPESDRREFRAHLAECSGCRDRAIAADPTLIFAAAPPLPASSDADAQARLVLESVKAALAVRSAARKIDRPRVRHGVRAAAAVAAAVLVALTSSSARRSRSVAVPVGRATTGNFQNAATKIVRPGADESPSMPSSATIYEWNPGTASPNDPTIVWIVDRSLDL
jgi:putative zinc finger protein